MTEDIISYIRESVDKKQNIIKEHIELLSKIIEIIKEEIIINNKQNFILAMEKLEKLKQNYEGKLKERCENIKNKIMEIGLDDRKIRQEAILNLKSALYGKIEFGEFLIDEYEKFFNRIKNILSNSETKEKAKEMLLKLKNDYETGEIITYEEQKKQKEEFIVIIENIINKLGNENERNSNN